MEQPQTQKTEKKGSELELQITANAHYIQEVFGCDYQKCLLWSNRYPGVSKEELLNACIENPDFFN